MSERKAQEPQSEEVERLLQIKRRAGVARRGGESSPPEAETRPAATPRYRSWRNSPFVGKLPTREIIANEPQPRFRSLAMQQQAEQKQQQEQAARKPKRLWDRLLLVVEIGAVIGLAALIWMGATQMRSLNEQTAEALSAVARNTAAPTTLAMLPGGSAPPTVAEVPAIYERFIRRVTPVVLPTPGPQAPTRILIGKIKVDAPVVQGSGWEDLKKGVGHHPGTGLPGMRGNMVLVAHDDVFGEIFRDLGQLEPGDVVTIYAGERAYQYVVRSKRIVEPSEISVMNPTHEPVTTLITCYPYGIDTHRLVVVAELMG